MKIKVCELFLPGPEWKDEPDNEHHVTSLTPKALFGIYIRPLSNM